MSLDKSLVRPFSRKGFTLIELLVVIAIILILIAIALPNFLEARLRAKVTAVKADQRTLQVALEAYRTEFPRYPLMAYHDPTPFWPLSNGPNSEGPNHASFMQLTTPTAYITEIPTDLFVSQREDRHDHYGNAWDYLNHPVDTRMGYAYFYVSQETYRSLEGIPIPNYENYGKLADLMHLGGVNYLVYSVGPDKDMDWNNGNGVPATTPPSKGKEARVQLRDACWYHRFVFSPTNGAKSNGDIVACNH